MTNFKLLVVLFFLLTSSVVAESIKGIAVDTEGQVGIGTDDPAHALHVEGNLYASGVMKGNGWNGRYLGAAVMQGFDLQTAKGSQYTLGRNFQGQIAILDLGAQQFKTFIIDHPSLLAADRFLVHASLEGPEGAVYYRGSAQLMQGQTVVRLPAYFEDLTQNDNRTVQLTNIDGFDRLAVKTRDGERIKDGAFTVISDNQTSNQTFDWEVKALRSDRPQFAVEPLKADTSVARFGPYSFQLSEPTLANAASINTDE